MALAIRIARAATGLDKVAFSGYHGWGDWYLAANLSGDERLTNHLLPGLQPKGVPAGLKGTSIPFLYNDVSDFERIINENPDVGVICVEGARHEFPNEDFLDAIMEKSRESGIVVISDEITSGWRLTDGGVYKLNGFQPDIVVYAKAMGGGYAISAIVGREEVMDAAQNSFVSSTMWTERVGFVAGLTTIEILTRERVWEQLNSVGDCIGAGWKATAERHGLNLTVSDFNPLITFTLGYGADNDRLITLYIQEMLKRGYLSAPSVYVSLAHTPDVVKKYLTVADEVFSIMADAIRNDNIGELLETTPRSDAFLRLT